MREDPPRIDRNALKNKAIPPKNSFRTKKTKRKWSTKTFGIMFLILMGLAGFLGVKFYSELSGRSAGAILGNLTERPFGGKDDVRLLMLGVDDKVENGRSDTMIVADIDLKNRQIHAISIPRDSRVQIPGRSNFEKINAAYAHGGAPLTQKVVEQIIGIPIDGYLKCNIGGFKDVVDAIGGVDLDVEKRMRYTDRAQKLFIRLDKGYQHLDGEKAMEYVRFRHDTQGDITRMQRQQKFLKAVIARLKAPGCWPKIPGVILHSHDFFETNLLPKDLTAITEMARNLKVENIKMDTLPGEAQRIDGVSYFVLDPVGTQRVVQEVLLAKTNDSVNTASNFETKTTAKPVVQILNGNGITGSASSARELLVKNGYKIGGTGNADNFSHNASVVISPRQLTASAQQITQLLGCGSIQVSQENGPCQEVTVILGKDYHPTETR